MNAEELLAGAVAAAADIGHMFNFIVTADDEPGVLVGAFLGDPPEDAFIGRQCGALGTRVKWSPDEREMRDVWVIVAVAAGEVAEAALGPYEGEWYRIEPLDFPWFMAATAGGIRSSIEKGQPLVPKHVKDPALFGRVKDRKPPAPDEHGRI